MSFKYETTLPLDGAGIIYPYTAKSDWTNEYRIEAKMIMSVNPSALKKAAEEMHSLYPYFFSHLIVSNKEYRLAYCDSFNIVSRDNVVCIPFDIESEEPLVRIKYTNNTIALEIFHCITDGCGAIAFFKEFLTKYNKYAYNICAQNQSQQLNTMLSSIEDIYETNYKNGGEKVSRFISCAFRFGKGQVRTPLQINKIRINTEILRELAHRHGVTITMLLCAFQIYSFLSTNPNAKRKIRISVPVDIRKFYGEATSRNASLYILVEYSPKAARDFESLLNSVKRQFNKQLTKENIQNLVYTNEQTENLKFFKALPLSLKKAVLKIGYAHFGENQFTSTLTNLGEINLPKNFENIIDDTYFILCENRINPLNLSVSSFAGITDIVISSTVDADNFIKAMLKELSNFGVSAETERYSD